MRQEPVVFLVVALVLALIGYSVHEADIPPRVRAQTPPELERFAAPDTALALPAGSAAPVVSRALFSPPRDTRPLPPLDFEEPPRDALLALAPPPAQGPAPRHFERFLRAPATPVDVPGLFTALDDDATAEPDELADADAEEDVDPVQRALRASGLAQAPPKAAPILSAEERAAQVAGYKQLYDWVVLGGQVLWGRIESQDRFALGTPAGAALPIRFVEVLPETGVVRYAGMAAIPYERARISDFGFADTAANGIELERARIGGAVTVATYRDVLAFADRCVARRLEAPRALEIAQEHYRLLAAFDPADPAPRLGLGRCLEAGFDFERAFGVYRELVASHGQRAAPHVRLAELEARFLLFDSAEARLREALRVDRTSWLAHASLGRLCARLARDAEALEHLLEASRFAPDDPALASVRAEIRADVGAAQLRVGRVPEARAAYLQALQADRSHQAALAGVIAAQVLEPIELDGSVLPAWLEAGPGGAAVDGGGAGLGFDVLLAAGQLDLKRGVLARARTRLLEAARADPLRAHQAWRALSWLAETTGFPEEAFRFAEQAFEANPGDPWTLYQRGRLLAERDDFEGARASFQAALEAELDFADALVGMGELCFRTGALDDAERYLERAAELSPKRVEVHSLRGIALLQQGAVALARASFERGKALAPRDPNVREGLAWCEYLQGRPKEALIQMAAVDEERRALPEDDPHRAWARRQLARIRDHAEMEVWSDGFERSDGDRLRNSWLEDEGAGLGVRLAGGAVVVEGVFQQSGEARVWQEVKASLFVALEADVWISGDSTVNAGLFVRREKELGRQSDVIGGISVLRHKDGTLQYVLSRRGQPDEPVDVKWLDDFQPERFVRLRIERSGADEGARVSIYVDGTPIAENLPEPPLGRAQTDMKVGLFVQGDTGRKAEVRLDNVEIVRRTGSGLR